MSHDPTARLTSDSIVWSSIPVGSRINIVGVRGSGKHTFAPWLWNHLQTSTDKKRWDYAIFIDNNSSRHSATYTARTALGDNNVCHELDEPWLRRQIDRVRGRPWLLHLSNFGRKLHTNPLLRDLIENSVNYQVDIIYDHQSAFTHKETDKYTDYVVYMQLSSSLRSISAVNKAYGCRIFASDEAFQQACRYLAKTDSMMVIPKSRDVASWCLRMNHERLPIAVIPGLGELERRPGGIDQEKFAVLEAIMNKLNEFDLFVEENLADGAQLLRPTTQQTLDTSF